MWIQYTGKLSTRPHSVVIHTSAAAIIHWLTSRLMWWIIRCKCLVSFVWSDVLIWLIERCRYGFEFELSSIFLQCVAAFIDKKKKKHEYIWRGIESKSLAFLFCNQMNLHPSLTERAVSFSAAKRRNHEPLPTVRPAILLLSIDFSLSKQTSTVLVKIEIFKSKN